MVGDQVLFSATDGRSPSRLWTTDGTTAGTASAHSVVPRPLRGQATLGATLFFVGDDGASGTELWRSDGTASGTGVVADLTPGPAGSTLQILAAVGGTVFFRVDVSSNRFELWGTDGTVVGTVPLGLTVGWSPSAGFGGELFFTGVSAATGAELWTSDGTVAGTVLVADLAPGPSGSFLDQLAVAEDTLFFQANTAGVGGELVEERRDQRGYEPGRRLDARWARLAADRPGPGGLAVLAPLAGSAPRLSVPIPSTPALRGVQAGLQVLLTPSGLPIGADVTNAVWWTLGQ
ncbi:MAG: hypothetical protein AAF628_28930 [Planctomycetota bacterium]